MSPSAEKLQHNIRVYGWIRMLMMRVYLPLTPIYLTQVGHVSIPQLGILLTIYGVTSLVANLPTGYLADRWTRKAMVVTGSVLLALGALTYAGFPSFWGAAVATALEAVGFSVISGASEALMHDTLLAQGRVHEYVKTLGRAQSFGLVGNVILVGLVPLTYALNPRLPFFIGALLSTTFVIIATTLIEPPRPAHQHTSTHNPLRILRTFVNRYTIVFFIALGLLSCSYRAYTSFENLVMADLGLQPYLQGIVFAAASVFGAINGRLLHHFKRLSLLRYSLFDLAIGGLGAIAIGLTQNLTVVIASFIIGMGFWRVRAIMYQDHLLGWFGHHHYKATLISTFGFFDMIHLWIPVLFALIMNHFGYYDGFVIIGISMILALAPMFVVGVKRLEANNPKKHNWQN